MVYNEFRSVVSFTPRALPLLPLAPPAADDGKTPPLGFHYDTPPEDILDALIPEVFALSLRLCLLNALASEHASRMTAMDSAVKNCREAIREQTLKMNNLRQAAITTELIEVVSGAESLSAS